MRKKVLWAQALSISLVTPSWTVAADESHVEHDRNVIQVGGDQVGGSGFCSRRMTMPSEPETLTAAEV